jgi:hypothetical protein
MNEGKYAVYQMDGKCAGVWAIVAEVDGGRVILHASMTPEEMAQHPDRNSDGTVKSA